MKSIILILLLLSSNLALGQFDNDEKDAPLLVAIRTNNIKEVKRLVETGEPINNDDRFEDDALALAIQLDHRDIALYLLSKGATSRSNFYSAVATGDIKWVKTLLTYKFTDSEAIIPAVEANNLEMVKLLIAEGFPVDFEQKRRTGLFRKHYVSPIEIALDEHHDQIALELVKAGAPLEEAFYSAALFEYNDLGKLLIDLNRQLNDLFLSSAKAGNQALLNYCITKGANITTKNASGKNALLFAAEYGRRDMYFYCITHLGLSANSITVENENALMLACRSGNAGLITEIIETSQNLEFQNAKGETVLFYAERCEAPEIFAIVLSKPVVINHRDKEGNTVLLKAAFGDRINHVKLLIEKGADIHVKNEAGKNIISGLMSNYNYNGALITELINNGVDPKVRSSDGRDFSFIAIERGDLELLKLLQTKGISVDGRNSSNQRPSTKNLEIMQFVIENGGDPNARDSWNNTYLCTALEMNDLAFASFLVKKNANVNIPSCFMDEFLLAEAIKKDNLYFVQFLVESKADLYLKDRWSKNVMELALDKNNPDIIAYLRSKGALTKDELNKREVERAKEMQNLHALIEKQALTEIMNLLNKYPEAILSNEETKALCLLSAQTGSVELVQICLERYKWRINDYLNFEQQTLLHVAVKNNQTNFTILSVNKGAKYDQEDAFGKTAVDYAKNKDIKLYFKNLKSKKKE